MGGFHDPQLLYSSSVEGEERLGLDSRQVLSKISYLHIRLPYRVIGRLSKQRRRQACHEWLVGQVQGSIME
jgi:hypothetical protein